MSVKIQEIIKECEQAAMLYNRGLFSERSAIEFIKTELFGDCITDSYALWLLHDCDYSDIDNDCNIEMIEIDSHVGSVKKYIANTEEQCMFRIYQTAVEFELRVEETGYKEYALYDKDGHIAFEYILQRVDEVIVLD